MENLKKTFHNIILENKNKLSISGVTDVDCFDERTVKLYTQLGELSVQGKDLHINAMSVETGEMQIEGEITALVYGSPEIKSPLSFIGKLFK